jgi:hypothetical protein
MMMAKLTVSTQKKIIGIEIKIENPQYKNKQENQQERQQTNKHKQKTTRFRNNIISVLVKVLKLLLWHLVLVSPGD